jgi:hypothetical protein
VLPMKEPFSKVVAETTISFVVTVPTIFLML